MAEWVLANNGVYRFCGKCLLATVHREGSDNTKWYVTCEAARLFSVQLLDTEGEQACNEAIGMVADRIGWLARGWIKDLKGVRSLILDDLDPAGRPQ